MVISCSDNPTSDNSTSDNPTSDNSNNDIFSENVKLIYSNDPDIALKALKYFRTMSSGINESKINLRNIFLSGIVPRVVDFLTYSAYPKHQYQASWLLTNLISGPSDIAKDIIENTQIGPYTVALLDTNDKELQNQAMWCIANISWKT